MAFTPRTDTQLDFASTVQAFKGATIRVGRSASAMTDGAIVLTLGHRSSKLTVGECSALIEFMLAYCAKEGLTVEHFDDERVAA